MRNGSTFGDSGTRRQVLVITVLIAILTSTVGMAVLSISGYRPADGVDGESAVRAVRPTDGLDHLHAAGVTGSNVTVGVVGVTGFDTEHPTLDGRVVAERSFAEGGSLGNEESNVHGTAAASVVARTAPDADLYLASFDTGDEFGDAVGWLIRNNVDVIVAPIEFYGKPGDGSSRVARVASLAAERGVVFVAPAGNLGSGHWQGRFQPAANGTHRFGDRVRNPLRGDTRRLTLWLSWPRHHSRHDFTVELYRANATGTRLVARSQPFSGDGVPNERIATRVDPGGQYYYVVRGPRNAAGVPIEVSSPTHDFRVRERAGSVVAPATGREVISVGAYDSREGHVEPFSSAGPIADGRPGIDVVAPDRLHAAGKPQGLVGSSAAAPYVAGVVALMLDVDPGLEPDAVESILERTAGDVAQPGDDPLTGSGYVDPDRAVRRARNASQT